MSDCPTCGKPLSVTIDSSYPPIDPFICKGHQNKPEDCKPPYPVGTSKWFVWINGRTEGIKIGRSSRDEEVKAKDAEIARLNKLIKCYQARGNNFTTP